VQAHSDQRMVTTGFILSLISGILITLQGALRIVRTQWGLSLGLGELSRRSLHGIDFKLLGIVALISGLMVLLGAFLIGKFGKEREGAITVIAFSVLTVFAGGGYYFIGVILGVIGAAFALSSYSPKKQPNYQNKALEN